MSPLITALSVVLAGVPVHQDPASAPRQKAPPTRPAPTPAGGDPLVVEAKLLTQQAAAGLDGDALCAHLDRTERLAQQLTARMGAAAQKAAGKGGSDPSDAALKKIKRDAQRAQAPGLRLEAVSAEGLDVGASLDPVAYAEKTHAPPATRAFLNAYSAFTGVNRAADIRYRFVTDEQACITFATVSTALTDLGAAWAAAPACLRGRALPAVNDKLKRFSDRESIDTCLCEDAPEAKRLAGVAVAQLAKIPELDAAALGKAITAAAVIPGARYSCNPAN
jgi:hypothetical protein